MPISDDHDEISLEMSEIMRERKRQQKFTYIYIAISFPINALILSIIVYVVGMIFGGNLNSTIVVVSCASYSIAVLGSYISILYSRVARMEMHALTLHSEILKNRDRISDVYSCVRNRG